MNNLKRKNSYKYKHNPKKYSRFRLYIITAFIVIAFSGITMFALLNLITSPPQTDDTVPFETDVLPQSGEEIDAADDSYIMSGVMYTRKEKVYNFFVAGESDQTDAMMIINYDVPNQKISVVQIPRDTYININRNFHKINSYYTGEFNRFAGQGLPKSERRTKSMEELVSFLEKNMNINIDYWTLLNLEGFRNVIDIIGGVEVEVPFDMDYDDPDQNLYIHLKKGFQLLDGDKAEQFVRFRDGYAMADIGRMDAQKIFMTALMNKMKTNFNIDKISKIITQIANHVDTSMPPKLGVYFASQLLKIDFSNISMMTLPTTSAVNPNTGAIYEVLIRSETLSIINSHLNVYNQNIPDSIFDINRVFTDANQKHIDDAYHKKLNIAEEKTASEIFEKSIEIVQK